MIKGGGLKHVPCVEDEDFIQALDKMMLENLQVVPAVLFGTVLVRGSVSPVAVRALAAPRWFPRQLFPGATVCSCQHGSPHPAVLLLWGGGGAAGGAFGIRRGPESCQPPPPSASLSVSEIFDLQLVQEPHFVEDKYLGKLIE